MPNNVSPQDRDMIVRTVLGEADDQPDVGQAAVAHVIMNRTASGKWGDTPTGVVLARGQFEPWGKRAKELNRIDPASDRYKRTAGIVDDVIEGRAPDPTGGATHFLQEDIVRKRRGGSLPDWASGGGLRIGDHTFYKPGEGAQAVAGGEDPLLDRYFGGEAKPAAGAPAAPQQAAPTAAAGDDPLLDRYFTPTGAQPAAAAPAASAAPPGALPTPPQVGTGRTWQTPQEAAAAEKTTREYRLEQVQPVIGTEIARLAAGVPGAISEHFNAGSELAASGWKDIGDRKILPSFPSADPRTWEGGGALKVGAGLTGAGLSPVSALIQQGIEKPVTGLTGNPEVGSRVAAVAPGLTVGKLAVKAAPSVRSANEIINAVGKESIPEAVSRLESNPRLTLMDVSTGVRTRTQGLAAKEGPPQEHLDRFVKDRSAGTRGAVGEAYSGLAPPPQALDVLDGIKQRARDVGRKEIQPALEKAGPVDVSPVIAAIDGELKPGMEAFAKSGLPLSKRQQELARLRQQLVTEKGEMRIDPQRLHEIQSANGTNAYEFSKSLDAEQKQAGAGLRNINEKLVDAIDAASGGAYRPARAKFAEAKDVHEAFDRGLMIGRARKGEAGITEDSPEAWSRWAKDAKPDEIDATKLGALSAIHMDIGAARNAARKGMDIPESEFTRGKLGILFGKPKADKLVQVLRDERDMATTHSKLFQGSKTAETLLGEKAMAVRDVKPIAHQGTTGMLPLMAGFALGAPEYGAGVAAAAMAGRAGLKGWQKVGQMSDIARNTAFARAASATGRERDDVLALLRSRMEPVGKQNKFADFLSSPIAQIAPK